MDEETSKRLKEGYKQLSKTKFAKTEKIFNKERLVPITGWRKYCDSPTETTMRNIVARRKENGAEEFLVFLFGKFYVDPDKFVKWAEKKSKQNEYDYKKQNQIKSMCNSRIFQDFSNEELSKMSEEQLFKKFVKWKCKLRSKKEEDEDDK